MNEPSASPLFVALLFILRCLVPLAILFGISYLLRKLGLVAETPEPPSGYEENGEDQPSSNGKKKKKNKKKER
ncbi:MAG: hypothetical protein HRF47_07845 [Chloroflexota bacterium]